MWTYWGYMKTLFLDFFSEVSILFSVKVEQDNDYTSGDGRFLVKKFL